MLTLCKWTIISALYERDDKDSRNKRIQNMPTQVAIILSLLKRVSSYDYAETDVT